MLLIFVGSQNFKKSYISLYISELYENYIDQKMTFRAISI